MANLTDKISQVKDEHASEELERRKANFAESFKYQSLFVLGRIKQTGHLATAISSNLWAQEIRALEHFQKEKMFVPLGFETFDDFLSNSEYSPMSKRQYYDRLQLVREHGDEIYDLLTSIGISVRSQKLLGTGDLSIKNDRLFVGENEIELADTGIIKDVLNEFFEERRALTVENEKKDKKIEKLQATVKQGSQEYDELRRSIDADAERSPFERALTKAIQSMITLVDEVKDLTDKQRAKRGDDDLKLFMEQWFRLRDAYRSTLSFVDNAVPAIGDDLMEKVLADEDFSDMD